LEHTNCVDQDRKFKLRLIKSIAIEQHEPASMKSMQSVNPKLIFNYSHSTHDKLSARSQISDSQIKPLNITI